MRLTQIVILAVLIPASPLSQASETLTTIQMQDLQLESSSRSGRSLYDYTYKVLQVNNGGDADDIIGRVEATSSNVEVIDGEFDVGLLNSGESKMSDTTITLRIDRSVPFDRSVLSWAYAGTLIGDAGPPTDDDIVSSYGELTSVQDENAFQPLGGTLDIKLSGAYFSENPGEITVSRNGDLIENFSRSAGSLTLPNFFINEKNHVVIHANDDEGLPMMFEATFWAGNKSVQINVVDESNTPTVADVTLKLSDEPSVMETVTFEGSPITVGNLPHRTIIVEAVGQGDRYGSTAFIAGSESSITIKIHDIAEPSPVSNLDFSRGTEGWVVSGPGHISIIP